jgi:hypothetical protein
MAISNGFITPFHQVNGTLLPQSEIHGSCNLSKDFKKQEAGNLGIKIPTNKATIFRQGVFGKYDRPIKCDLQSLNKVWY